MKQLIVARLRELASNLEGDKNWTDDELVRLMEGLEDLEELVDYIKGVWDE